MLLIHSNSFFCHFELLGVISGRLGSVILRKPHRPLSCLESARGRTGGSRPSHFPRTADKGSVRGENFGTADATLAMLKSENSLRLMIFTSPIMKASVGRGGAFEIVVWLPV